MDKGLALAPAKETTLEQELEQFAPRKVIGPRDMVVDTHLGKIKVEPAVEVKVEAAAALPLCAEVEPASSVQGKEVIVKEKVDIEVEPPTPVMDNGKGADAGTSSTNLDGSANSNANPGKPKRKKRRAVATPTKRKKPLKMSLYESRTRPDGCPPKLPKFLRDMKFGYSSKRKPQ